MKIHPSPPIITSAAIEWLSPRQATKLFGIGRSSLYILIASGAVKSRSVRLQGNIRGKRLISAESLRLFLENSPVHNF